MAPRLLSSSSINGTDVKNTAGESIGEIKDLMIDWHQGRVGYAVLSFGGFMGFGEKLFAIPLDQFDFNASDDKDIVLNVSKEKLENAPGFDDDKWPQNADTQFINSVYTHYDTKSYWNESAH